MITYSRKMLAALKRHEGFRGEPYRCPTGHLTIGYGRNLDSNPLTPSEATELMINDLRREEAALTAINHVYPKVAHGPRRDALLNMAFNIGAGGLNKFRKMWTAIGQQDWDRAADEALDSKWARQVGYRSREIAEQLRTGEYSR